ncbi:MAG: TetR/AcrR family transcriptional regulator [Chloroflexaceae bacterium]|nr:TetR/AcrR family transcriptional regulator [Chloroflexaceae bacterium]
MTVTPSLRERRRQMLRDEIIQAAQNLIAEKGHILMSMDELAARVGISKPTLYSYFDTKDALIVAAATRKLQQVLDVLGEEPSGQTPLQRLVLALKVIIQNQIDMQALTLRPWTPELFAFLCEHRRPTRSWTRLIWRL